MLKSAPLIDEKMARILRFLCFSGLSRNFTYVHIPCREGAPVPAITPKPSRLAYSHLGDSWNDIHTLGAIITQCSNRLRGSNTIMVANARRCQSIVLFSYPLLRLFIKVILNIFLGIGAWLDERYSSLLVCRRCFPGRIVKQHSHLWTPISAVSWYASLLYGGRSSEWVLWNLENRVPNIWFFYPL